MSDWFTITAYLILFPLLIFKNLPFIGAYSLMAELVISPSPDIAIVLIITVICLDDTDLRTVTRIRHSSFLCSIAA